MLNALLGKRIRAGSDSDRDEHEDREVQPCALGRGVSALRDSRARRARAFSSVTEYMLFVALFLDRPPVRRRRCRLHRRRQLTMRARRAKVRARPRCVGGAREP